MCENPNPNSAFPIARPILRNRKVTEVKSLSIHLKNIWWKPLLEYNKLFKKLFPKVQSIIISTLVLSCRPLTMRLWILEEKKSKYAKKTTNCNHINSSETKTIRFAKGLKVIHSFRCTATYGNKNVCRIWHNNFLNRIIYHCCLPLHYCMYCTLSLLRFSQSMDLLMEIWAVLLTFQVWFIFGQSRSNDCVIQTI